MAANKPCDVLADRIVEIVKGVDDWGVAGSAVSRLLRAEDRRLARAVDEVRQQPSFTAQVRSALSGDHPESEAFLSLLADEMRREIERLRVHRDAWQDALYCIREQYGEEATTGSEQAEFAMTICDKIRAKALGLLLDEFKSEAAAAAGGK